MKKVNLSFMAVIIISLIIILIMNAMAVFAYYNEILSMQNRKDNLLNLNIKYTKLLENLDFNAKQYLLTNDEKYKSDFYSLFNSYRENDRIPIEFRVFTRQQAGQGMKDALNDDFTIASQAKYIGFDKQEKELYDLFLEDFNRLLDTYSTAVSARDPEVIKNSSLNVLNQSQSEIMTELSKTYIDRQNHREDTILLNQHFLEHSLVGVSLLLLGFAAATFCLILKENAYNSYISKLYYAVVENIDSGIAIFDNNYHADYMNSKYKEIFNIAAEDPLGKPLRDTFDQSLSEMIESTLMDDRKAEVKLDLIIGNKKRNIVSSYIVIDDERGSSKYVHLIRDTTKTEELQLQLRKQLKEINYYSQAKDSFIANISHEIKTPINAILGMVHFLKGTRLSQNQKELVRKIETSSDILLTIISDVLDLSKIKNNSLSLYPSDFSLEMVIKNIEDMFSNQLSQKGLEWRTEYDYNKNLCLHLDKTRFVQVLVNLINNACKFTDSGYIKLRIETRSENSEMVFLEFCIEDTGIGIAEKDISKLFHEFEQLENHLTKQHQGTGLGLYICKNIIESMDGRMWVKSTKGEGSKFYFSLPAKKSLGTDQGIASICTSALPFNGSGGKALVVEDTEINAEVAVHLLNDVQISCDTAMDGLAAIELCKTKPADYYNVILMDIHMPNMDGYTAASILKRELGVTSPIVALTASDINEQIRKENAFAIESFILKPFKAVAFYNSIAPYFANRNQDDQRDSGIEAVSEADQANDKQEEAEGSRDPFAGRAEAIKNLGGMESLYRKHVQKFKQNYANSAEHIHILLEEENQDEARRLAHTLKGLGGTLGMLDVMETSAELERAILKGKDYDLSIEMGNFKRELKKAIEAI